MEVGFSLYLELIRFGAALLVFFGHIMRLSPAITQLFQSWYIEHDGVVIFFVLSGYVIAYVTAEKEKSLYNYTVNRMARIYSVALPALILALIVEFLFWQFGHSQLGPINFGNAEISNIQQIYNILKNFFTSIIFLNEIRWNNILAFSDGPYWSLGYEVWYYALFAVFFFSCGWQRWLWSGVIALFVGIKVMLLFPVWLIGVAVYHMHRHYSIGLRNAWIIWLVSIGIGLVLKFYDPFMLSYHYVGQPLERVLHHTIDCSQRFAWDYLLGILVGANIFASRYISLSWLLIAPVSRVIKYCASYTFSMYLYQMPFLILWSLVIWPFLVAHHFPNYLKIFILVAFILASVIVLGRFTEHKKQVVRDWIKSGFAKWQSVRMRKRSVLVITN